MTAVTIETVAAGGDGVGRLPDGMTVFVPRAAPGDTVEIELTTRKQRWARGRVTHLVTPGPDRVEPPCRHYAVDECGGCQLQHISQDGQLAAKRRIVGDALRRIAGRTVDDPPVAPAPRPLQYRARITVAVSPDGRIGFHPFGRPDRVFELEDCAVARPGVMAQWRGLRGAAGLLPAGVTQLDLREDRDGTAHVIVRGGVPPWNPRPLYDRLADPAASLWWQPQRGAARVVAGPRTGFPVLAFAQANPDLAERVRRDAVDALGDVAGLIVWDLYGGVGDTACLLAGRGARVTSVESDRSAVEWARSRPGPEGVPGGSLRYLHARVEEALHRLPAPDAVVLNPPRVGIGRRVAEALQARAERAPAGWRACYVSCDPATLARDLKRLPALALTRVQAYDLFPQTSHVEVLAVLEAP